MAAGRVVSRAAPALLWARTTPPRPAPMRAGIAGRAAPPSRALRFLAVAFVPAMFFDWARLAPFTLADNPTSIIGVLLALAFVASPGRVASAFRVPGVLGVLYVVGMTLAFLLGSASFGAEWVAKEWPLWFQFAQAGVLFVILAGVLRDVKALRGVAVAFLLSCIVMSLMAHLGLGPQGAEFRGYARVGVRGLNLNQQAFRYGLGVLGTVFWAVLRWRSIGLRELGAFAGAASMLFALVKTGSRGGVVLVVVGLVAGAFLLLRRRGLARYVVTMPLLAGGTVWVIAGAPVVQRRFQEALEGNTGMRVELTQSSWEMFKQRPLAGWGASYVEELGEFVGIGRRIAAHNTFMQILVAFGLVGFAPWFAMIIVLLWRLWRVRGHPIARAVLALYLAALAFAAVGNEAYDKPFAILLAIVAVLPALLQPVAVRPVAVPVHPSFPARAVRRPPAPRGRWPQRGL